MALAEDQLSFRTSRSHAVDRRASAIRIPFRFRCGKRKPRQPDTRRLCHISRSISPKLHPSLGGGPVHDTRVPRPSASTFPPSPPPSPPVRLLGALRLA